MTTTTKQTNFLQGIRLPGSSTKTGRFIWHFLEMMLSMEVGGILFQLLAGLLPESSSFAPALQPKAFWYTTGTALGMTITMVGWMVVRDHGWRHSLEMAVAMLAPVALVAVVCLLAGPASLPWYAGLNCPVMCLGMLALMLYRKDHFTGQADHSTHAPSSDEAPCH